MWAPPNRSPWPVQPSGSGSLGHTIGSGALAAVDVLPGGADPNSYFGSYGSFCSAGETGVVVLDDVARA